MCYAIPAKIIEIKNENASVDYGGIKKEINISLLENLKTGDYVLVHAGFAIEKMGRESAEKTLRLVQEQLSNEC